MSLESTPIEYGSKWRHITTIVEVGGRMRKLERSEGVEKSETWCDGEIGLSLSRPRQFTSLQPNKATDSVKVRWHIDTLFPSIGKSIAADKAGGVCVLWTVSSGRTKCAWYKPSTECSQRTHNLIRFLN